MGEGLRTGEHLEIDRPRRLVFTSAAPQLDPGYTRVEIAPAPGGCEVSLIQSTRRRNGRALDPGPDDDPGRPGGHLGQGSGSVSPRRTGDTESSPGKALGLPRA